MTTQRITYNAQAISDLIVGYAECEKQEGAAELIREVFDHQATTSSSPFLHWTQRPKTLQKKITAVFEKIASDTSSKWGLYKGDTDYNLCGIEDHNLMKTVIQQAPSSQKDFYAMDIGAGNFEWGNALACFINEQEDLRQDITVHIISVRGETSNEESVTAAGLVKLYKFGCFKIEEIGLEFERRKLLLENRVDLIVSRWCFRHLSDSVGTFTQTYNLLRPRTGLFLVDGFMFLLNQNKWENSRGFGFLNAQMIRLLLDTKASFLMQDYDLARSLHRFILRRADDLFCKLPMSYADIYTGSNKYDSPARSQINSGCITRFQREPQGTDTREINWPADWSSYHGDKGLYDWLTKHALLPKTVGFGKCAVPVTWGPILKDSPKEESKGDNKSQ